jgi:hypothetical protein
MTVEEAWKDLLVRCPDLAQAYRRQKGQRLVSRIGMAAAALVACIALVMGIGGRFRRFSNGLMAVSSYAKPDICDSPNDDTTKSMPRYAADLYLMTARTDSYQTASTGLVSVDYGDWRDGRRDWFQKEFPWIFRVEDELKAQGRNVDYVELLVVSGDIWQFKYVADGPISQEFASVKSQSLAFLDARYSLNAKELSNQTGRAGELVSAATTRDSDASDAKNLKQWANDISSAAANPRGFTIDDMIIMLRAATYLQNTRTAAYLWIKSHREEAQQYPAVREHGNLQDLSEQIIDAQTVAAISENLLSMPSSDQTCGGLSPGVRKELSDALQRLAK